MTSHKRTGAQEAFMRWALQGSCPGRPLSLIRFLVNPTTKNWYGRYGSRREDAQQNEHDPAVQAGHLVTFAALDDTKNERLALQDADATAKMWEATEMLPEGTLTAAQPHSGWALN